MRELTVSEITEVSGGGGVSSDAAFGGALGAAGGFLALGVGMALAGPAVVGAGLIYAMLGSSVASSAIAGYIAW